MSVSLSRRRRIAIVLLVLGVFLLPRTTALGHFVTPDESRWLSRSANFYQALRGGRLVDTFQSNHPGVTAMWVGTLAFVLKYPEYPAHVRSQVPITFSGVEAVLRAQGRSTLDMLVTARFLLLLVQTGLLLLAGWYAVRLLSFGPTMVGFALLAIDPFHIVNTRILHLDALQGSLMLVSVLALITHVRGSGQQRHLVISGVAAGLAVLTKIPAILLVPFAGLFLLVNAWQTRSPEPDERLDWTKATVKDFAIWSLFALAIVVLLWPASWNAPRHTLEGVFFPNSTPVGTRGNQAPAFFMGRIERNMSPLVYPLSYAWTTAPILWAGVVLAVVAAVRRWSPLDGTNIRFVSLSLTTYALLYSVALMFVGQKATRYLLPVHLVFMLLAGAGWVAAGRRVLQAHHVRVLRLGTAAALALLVLQHSVALARSAPYYQTYDNALLGGRRTMRMIMNDGGGEGLDLAARYLNTLPDAEKLVVCSWYGYGAFSYYFRGATTVLEARWSEDLAQRLDTADYMVAYEHQWPRRLPSEQFVKYLDGIRPEHVVRIDGFEYARIYKLRGTPIAADLRRLHDGTAAAAAPGAS